LRFFDLAVQRKFAALDFRINLTETDALCGVSLEIEISRQGCLVDNTQFNYGYHGIFCPAKAGNY
jgi:hypothetical protein